MRSLLSLTQDDMLRFGFLEFVCNKFEATHPSSVCHPERNEVESKGLLDTGLFYIASNDILRAISIRSFYSLTQDESYGRAVVFCI